MWTGREPGKTRAVGPEAFEYDLPPELIAHAPAPTRTASRLLVVGASVEHATVRALPEVLARHLARPPLVVVNDSQVVPARLYATRVRDGRCFELLLCAPGPGQGPGAVVEAWVRGARRLAPEDSLEAGALRLVHEPGPASDPRARRFRVVAGEVLPTLRARGELPLPPYVRRPEGPRPEDAVRYQTVYARAPGSVAAPTAGLHLDEALLATLDPVRITLHVGPGTFLPLEAADVREHRVGAERFEVGADAAARIEGARAEGRSILAVGTTTTRVLEGLARDGAPIRAGRGTTDLVIVPGHRFRVVSALLTNFHLPRSSLLMLACAFAGRARLLAAYREAVARRYRFYSYGDATLLLPPNPPSA